MIRILSTIAGVAGLAIAGLPALGLSPHAAGVVTFVLGLVVGGIGLWLGSGKATSAP